jgi:alkylhydroperoxidase family enzyme
MDAYLSRIEKPQGLFLKIVYYFSRKQSGKVISPIAIFAARMPNAFASFYGKIATLDKKLQLPKQTQVLVREHVASLNGCGFCMDSGRWYAARQSPEDLERLDVLPEYQTSPLFTDAQRAALDYATELTRDKHVTPGTFTRLTRYYNEREICEIDWLVASEHVNNISNIGLNIGSDGLCEIPPKRPVVASTIAR